MKLINILITLVVSGFANAQHRVPAPATSNANINGGINSPTLNSDIKGVAVIIDETADTTRKLKSAKASKNGGSAKSAKSAKSVSNSL